MSLWFDDTTLRKKGLNGCDSPDIEADDSAGQSPESDDKYRKINEDIDLMINRQRICGVPPSSYDMGASIPASNPGSLLYSHPGLGCGIGNASYANHCTSPGLLSGGVNKNMQEKSPPMSLSRKPDLRTLMPPSNKCNNMPTICEDFDLMLNQRINHSQSAQTLSTPAVSIAAQTLPGQGLGGYPSTLASSYGTRVLPRQRHVLPVRVWSFWSRVGDELAATADPEPAALSARTHGELVSEHEPEPPSGNQHLHIKSEPASPPRDRSVGMIGLGGGVTTAGYSSVGGRGPNEPGRSPADSASSCGSSYEGSEEREDHLGNDNFLLRPLSSQEEHHSPSVKRMRLSEGWAT
ncbi:Myocyte-specific enhancer factor 2C [Collichthys lucidus]|uniref:Myocyte-specific enhancer factor 2C n=1 Tax=Collichthys lucidus TaxID=240159 RepID=A0A4U5VBZ2_COLLU|nr:Myocyte-specific enhancer factor 2C [Collichthys lucidus]